MHTWTMHARVILALYSSFRGSFHESNILVHGIVMANTLAPPPPPPPPPPPKKIFVYPLFLVTSLKHMVTMGGKNLSRHAWRPYHNIDLYHIKRHQWQGRDCSNEDIKITSTLLVNKAKYITKYRVVAALSASWWIYRNSELTNSRINDETKYRFKVQIWRQNEHSSICTTAKGIGWTWCSNLSTKVCEVSNTKRGQPTKGRSFGFRCAEGTDWSKGQGWGGHRGVGRSLERGWFVWVFIWALWMAVLLVLVHTCIL